MSVEKPRKPVQANEGIQANNVTAEVIAVGRHARATKTASGDSLDLAKSIHQFQSALEALDLKPQVKAGVEEELAALHTVVQSNQPAPEQASHLMQSLAGKLKSAGVVLSEIVTLAEPARKIAELLRVPLHLLGL
jgi:hypothetical protein